ncbi:MAG: putative zinc-binding metallopeptidase, partial [Rhizobiales bacterium]|nr:putative zinc-binding metallopeptidase [Hyphomicrobiales bacterium]
MPRRFAWSTLPDEELLKLRLKDLGIGIEGTWLEGPIAEVNEELEQRGLRVKPHYWLSDEWFSPDNTPGIALPFYLAHPRLMRLERRMILDVEGGTESECRRIIRHEAGHVIQHSYLLHRRRRWTNLFGPSSQRYPHVYRPNPASRNFVQHLPRWYAQAHPDEDFAETFAVWLSPRSDWRTRYAEWPALKKLEYVEALMREIADEEPALTRRVKVDPLSRLTTTLGEH